MVKYSVLKVKRSKDFWKEFVTKLNGGLFDIPPYLSSYMAMRINCRLYTFQATSFNNLSVKFVLHSEDYDIAKALLDETTL